MAGRVLAQLHKTLFVPHIGGQRQVMASQARFRVLCAGRRWGKTHLGSRELINAALSKPNQMVWCVAQADKGVRRVYRKVLTQLPRMLLSEPPPKDSSNDRILRFKNGSTIEFYTAGSPDALAGEGVNFVLVDEAALISASVWQQLIRPTLSDTKGRALLISTPRGRDWFHQSWTRGQDDSKQLWQSWRFPSVTSPFVDQEEVEDAKDTLPRIIFEQEYEAAFVANAASIFTLEGIHQLEDQEVRWNAVRPNLVEPQGWITMGVDLAKKEDFTVISASNAGSRLPCYYERFNEISWPQQERIIQNTVAELEARPGVEGVTVVVDSGGVGDVVYDHLDELGMDVVPINFGSGLQKEKMVRLLAADLEHGRAHVLEDQRDEFEAYAYEITANGRYKFEAPDGLHDDKVSAKLLENWGHVHEAPPGVLVHNPSYEDEEDFDPVYDDIEDEIATSFEDVDPDSAADIANRAGAWG